MLRLNIVLKLNEVNFFLKLEGSKLTLHLIGLHLADKITETVALEPMLAIAYLQ